MAAGYLGGGIAYASLAIASDHPTIQSMLQVSNVDKGTMIISILRTLILPTLLITVITITLHLCFRTNGILLPEGTPALLPLALLLLFGGWAIGQAITFRVPAEKVALRVSSDNDTVGGNTKTMYWTIGAIVQIAGILILIFFFSIKPRLIPGENGSGVFESIIHGARDGFIGNGAVYLTLCALLVFLAWLLTKRDIDDAYTHPGGKRWVTGWSVTILVFATWHMSSFHRKTLLGATGPFEIGEEISLMLFTILMATWALTGKARKSGTQRVHEGNAIHWAIAFSFAYAGSVATLTHIGSEYGILQNPQQALGIGHLITAFSLLLLHRQGIRDKIMSDTPLN